MTEHAEHDPPLVARARQGDLAAFEALVAEHQQWLFSLALRIVRREHDAEEVVQQTFLSVIEHLKDFRDQSSFRTWIARIATNHALALLRKRAVRRTVPLGDDRSEQGDDALPHPQFIAEWRETPEQIASRRETRELLDQALDALDEKYRLVFLLRDVKGLSTSETAEALALSPSNVKVRLLRARLMLRERLTRIFGDEASRVAPDHTHHGD